MSSATDRERLDWLAAAASSGDIHTVRLSWPDRLGTMRGKRLPVDLFLESPERRIGFCDGMIVVDVNCDVIQETPFSNFETGYPDMYLTPRPDTLARVGWSTGEALVFGRLENHGGRPLGVSPSNVLAGVTERLARAGITVEARLAVSGRLMAGRNRPFRLLADGSGIGESEPGILRQALEGLDRSGVGIRSMETDRQGGFRFSLDWETPAFAAQQAVLVKAALKELARQQGIDAVFMTVLPEAPGPSRLDITLRLSGAVINPESLRLRLAPARGLLQPSVNAFKAGSLTLPTASPAGDDVILSGLAASSEADPATALMTLLAAVGADSEPADAAPEDELNSFADAAIRLSECGWARDWLGGEFVDNAVPLLSHEAALFESAVTDWELDRYWSAA